MADNSTLPATGDVIASDDIGGVKYQRVKLVFGPNNTSKGDVDTINPLPVMLASSSTASWANNSSTAATTGSAVLMTANLGGRAGAVIHNNSTSVLYVLLSAGTATSTNYSVKLVADGHLVLGPGDYSGQISGSWATANGFAAITEFYTQ